MEIQTLLGINGYSLLICYFQNNLYRLNVVERSTVVHSFEGIYPTRQAAIERGKSVIQNLESSKLKASSHR